MINSVNQDKELNKYFHAVTVCPRSSDPLYIVSYYTKWATTSGTHSRYLGLPDGWHLCGFALLLAFDHLAVVRGADLLRHLPALRVLHSPAILSVTHILTLIIFGKGGGDPCDRKMSEKCLYLPILTLL